MALDQMRSSPVFSRSQRDELHACLEKAGPAPRLLDAPADGPHQTVVAFVVDGAPHLIGKKDLDRDFINGKLVIQFEQKTVRTLVDDPCRTRAVQSRGHDSAESQTCCAGVFSVFWHVTLRMKLHPIQVDVAVKFRPAGRMFPA